MFKKIILCLVLMASVFTVEAFNVGYCADTAQIQQKDVWFYSDGDMEYWITGAKKHEDSTYGVTVTPACNGKMGTIFHIYEVKCENGVAYTSYFYRMKGTWGEWEHSDFAQALWNACVEYY